MDEQTKTRMVTDVLFARDRASRAMGMRIVDVAPGFAKLAMPVRRHMVQGHGSCHGGVIFTLADSAFAFACNGRNVTSVAQSCDIDFVAPAKLDDVLIAEAQERHLGGRSGVYDVTVTREADGAKIALFRGRSHALRGHNVPALEDGAVTA